MIHEVDEEGFISGIHNYCDRWCERCRFAMQCRVYEGISDENGNIKKLTIEETMKEVSENFKKTFEMIATWADEQGIDLDELTKDNAEIEKKEKAQEKKVNKHKLFKATDDYTDVARKWLEGNRPAIDERSKEIRRNVELGINTVWNMEAGLQIRDALDALYFYVFPIHVKTSRALHGLYDDPNDWDDPIQNDYNGSAKVALLETERSLKAFSDLHRCIPELADSMLPLMALLEKIRKGLLSTFPNASKFIRPGFDTGA